MMKTAKSNKLFVAVIGVIGIFFLEILLSNFVWFAYAAGKTDAVDVKAAEGEVFTVSPESPFVDVECESITLNSIVFTINATEELYSDILATVNFYVFDENNITSATMIRSEKITVGNIPRKYRFYLNSRGDMSGFSVEIKDIDTECAVSDIVINPQYEFSFNALRFSVMLLAAALVFLAKSPNGKRLRDEMTFAHAGVISCAVCCGAAILMWSFAASGESGSYISYPLDGEIKYYSPYIQQLDAFIKGQIHLDIQPSAELLALGNPYTPDNREGIEFVYDRAFFGGRYYSYFGIAPILVFYYPYYLITGNIPADSSVMGFFSLITALFLPLSVVEWCKFRKSGMRPWLSCVVAAGAYFASGALIIQRGRAAFYYVASLAAMAFASAYLFWLIKALGSKKIKRAVSMLLAGSCFSLGFLSRINTVLPLAIVTAVFIVIYLINAIKEKKFAAFVGDMLPLGIPVAASLVFSLYYNYIRFGEIFQFGTDYQLTLANASLYDAGANGIIPALFHYFLQPFSVSNEFPYLTFSYLALRDYGKQVYIDSNFGVFAMPFMLSLLLSVVLFKSKKISRSGKIMLASSLIALFVTAYLNFCYGGVIFRYTADLTVLAAFTAAAVISEICLILQRNYHAYVSCAAKKSVCGLTASTAAVSVLASVMLNGNLVSFYPAVHTAIRDFFVFWN
ncbi:MAG: hypothetical protein IKJ41_09705 [Clostridia bacterium]|nr:hypothetical protein [Clostridia bacterium]